MIQLPHLVKRRRKVSRRSCTCERVTVGLRTLWTNTLDESLNVNSVNSPWSVIIQDEGWKKLAADTFGSLWVSHRKCTLEANLSACSFAVNNGSFSCSPSGLFFCCVWKYSTLGFKWKDGHTPCVLDFMKECECSWNRKSEYSRNKTTYENALHEIVQEWIFRNSP
jgi:hypothetical protein